MSEPTDEATPPALRLLETSPETGLLFVRR